MTTFKRFVSVNFYAQIVKLTFHWMVQWIAFKAIYKVAHTFIVLFLETVQQYLQKSRTEKEKKLLFLSKQISYSLIHIPLYIH